ncbi:GAF and ANTAR domain-containing protein [Prescottella soli]|uniref:GAF and ANTAR domain-containing protein n=1 Tax=Prescottella soli TaxID=1543852 RepID=A0ABW9G2N7_9NOCA
MGYPDDSYDELGERFDDLNEALQQLSDVLDEYDELTVVLQHLVETAVRIVPDADLAGVTLLNEGTAPETVAANHPNVREVDAAQYAGNRGPGLVAAREGRSVVADVDEVRALWPELEEPAARVGVKSFIAFPLSLSDETQGSFNLYSSDPQGFRSLDESLLEVFTTAAVTALLQAERHRRAVRSIRNLQQALTSRADIDHAIGVVMALHSISSQEAFDRLVGKSQESNVKLRVVARQLLDKVTNGSD